MNTTDAADIPGEYYFSIPEYDKYLRELIYKLFPDVIDPEKSYNAWLIEYLKLSDAFYYHQYRWNFNKAEFDFKKIFHIDPDITIGEVELSDEWEDYQIEMGVRNIKSRVEDGSLIRRMRINQLKLEFGFPEKGLRSAIHVSDYFEYELNLAKHFIDLDSYWFYMNIGETDEACAILKQMPYPEYLHTVHWRKIRAAMILINGASCQAESCSAMGENWYGGGWESDLNVHHLSYKNKGNEKYEDLELLCKVHHEAISHKRA